MNIANGTLSDREIHTHTHILTHEIIHVYDKIAYVWIESELHTFIQTHIHIKLTATCMLESWKSYSTHACMCTYM
uniref:Uncharacterized protein n=1 Tax=Octopus bimaculoides TaxID=37653 RepID=A0A0L8GPU0_OCTBM